MQIVIDIPDQMYERVLDGTYCGTLYEELKNGTPLPKGHGRLIDANEIEQLRFKGGSYIWLVDKVLKAPTIIEAYKAESEDKE